MILILFGITLVIGLLAQWHVKRTYARHTHDSVQSGLTGAEVARRILQQEGMADVAIVEHGEPLGDHYDPSNKRLVLSSMNYRGRSAAALGVAAHECGHVIQHKMDYAPLQIRMAAISVTGFASQLVLWIPLSGLVTGLLATKTGLIIMAVAWGILMLFNLITLPVEFDASRRAKQILDRAGFIQAGHERMAVNEVLNAAALTYVAAFITSLIYFLWHLLPLLSGRQRN